MEFKIVEFDFGFAILHCAWICFALNGAGGIMNFICSRCFSEDTDYWDSEKA